MRKANQHIGDIMTKKEQKEKAQDLIMYQISIIGYGTEYDEYKKEIGNNADEVLKSQMDRIAKMFGYDQAWFS